MWWYGVKEVEDTSKLPQVIYRFARKVWRDDIGGRALGGKFYKVCGMTYFWRIRRFLDIRLCVTEEVSRVEE